MGRKYPLKAENLIGRRWEQLNVFCAVDRYQIDVAVEGSQQAMQLFRVFQTGVDIFNENVFKGHPASCFLKIIPSRLYDILYREGAAGRKDTVAYFIIRRMKGNSQRYWNPFISQTVDTGNDAAGGQSHVAIADIADIEQLRIMTEPHKAKYFLIILQWFS